ncbi:MAG: hypothetical protein WA840_07710 [Caulobacteraceae bacterium]
MKIQTISGQLAWGGALLLLAGVAACHPKSLSQAKSEMIGGGAHISSAETLNEPVTVATRLDCPDAQGALKRTAVAADGRSCAYRSDRGVVELALVDTPNGDAETALQPWKARTDAMLPHQASGATVAVVSEKGPDGRDVSKVDMPFIHVSDDGRRSHVKVFGITVDSKDTPSKNETGAADAGGHGREVVYILAGSPPSPEGYHAVGYIARGDGADRMVVATFKYLKEGAFNSGENHGNDRDLDALLDLNAKKG